MNRILLTMTAVGALAAAAPAAAQYADANAGSAARIHSRIAQLETRIGAGIQAGTITRAEARPLRRQLMRLHRLEQQYGSDGLTAVERNDLQTRIRDLRQEVRVADGMGRDDRYGNWDDDDDRYADRVDRNNDGWDDRDYDRDGRWDDDANDGRYAGRIDRNNDGWDDRDYDRDGRWDDDVNDGRGGPYEEADCQNRGGIGGIFDSVLGRDCAGLRVGQRASANLGAVPYQYRSRYRDGNGSYYRSDGRSIYQIDSRTNAVVRIYPIN